MAAVKRLLEQTTEQMATVIFKSGYNDPKAFRKIFRKTVGMTPSEYREKFYVGVSLDFMELKSSAYIAGLNGSFIITSSPFFMP